MESFVQGQDPTAMRDRGMNCFDANAPFLQCAITADRIAEGIHGHAVKRPGRPAKTRAYSPPATSGRMAGQRRRCSRRCPELPTRNRS